MSKAHAGVERVLAHDPAITQLRTMLCNQLACGGVLVLEVAGLAHRHEQKVVRQEVEHAGLDVVAQNMQLHAVLVVDVHVLLLCRRVQRVVVQDGDVTRRLANVELRLELEPVPIHHSEVALVTTKEHVSGEKRWRQTTPSTTQVCRAAAGGVIHVLPATIESASIRAKLIQRDVQLLARHLLVHRLHNVALLELVGPLQISVRFQIPVSSGQVSGLSAHAAGHHTRTSIPGILGEQQLRPCSGFSGCRDLALGALDATLELLVLHLLQGQ